VALEEYLCATCGTLFPPAAEPPPSCPICSDERQYVPGRGQRWTTMADLQDLGHRQSFFEEAEGLIGIATVPEFAIGHRALLVRTDEGNVLWDPVPFVDHLTVEIVQGLGGVRAIAASHPHFFGSLPRWAASFGAPVYLHASARPWVQYPTEAISYWQGDMLPLFGGVTLVRLGGHFACSSVLHWRGGAGGAGAVLSGDTIMVSADRRRVSFLYSYPNRLPLPAEDVAHIRAAVETLSFTALFGGWRGDRIEAGAREAVLASADRYLAILQGAPRPEAPA
jgi:hypothetical protein